MPTFDSTKAPRPKRGGKKLRISSHAVVVMESSLKSILNIHERMDGEEGSECSTCASLGLEAPLLYPCPTVLHAEKARDQLDELKAGRHDRF